MDLRRTSRMATPPMALGPSLSIQTQTLRATTANKQAKTHLLIWKTCQDRLLRCKGSAMGPRTLAERSKAQASATTSNCRRTQLLAAATRRTSALPRASRTPPAIQEFWRATARSRTRRRNNQPLWSRAPNPQLHWRTSRLLFRIARPTPQKCLAASITGTCRVSSSRARETWRSRTTFRALPPVIQARTTSWAIQCRESNSIRIKWARTRARTRWPRWASWSSCCWTSRPSTLRS